MKYFVDVNVLVDIFAARQPFVKTSLQVLENVKKKGWVLYVSDHSTITLNYLTARHYGNYQTRRRIAILLNQVEVIPITKSILFSATSTKFNDFEDAVQFHRAASITGINGIITRNKKDFKASTIPVFS